MPPAPDKLTVEILRNAFRSLALFRATYEASQVDVISFDGVEICLWDLENIYRQLPDLLSPRQWQAVDMFLVAGYMESEVAEAMGISPTSPIGQYATNGLVKLLRLLDQGKVEGWKGSLAFRGGMSDRS